MEVMQLFAQQAAEDPWWIQAVAWAEGTTRVLGYEIPVRPAVGLPVLGLGAEQAPQVSEGPLQILALARRLSTGSRGVRHRPARVLVVVTPVAEQLPVAAVWRVVGVVVVLVMHGEVSEIAALEVAATAGAHPGQQA